MAVGQASQQLEQEQLYRKDRVDRGKKYVICKSKISRLSGCGYPDFLKTCLMFIKLSAVQTIAK